MADAMRLAYVVCFDISDDKVRNRIGRELMKYGCRVQESVFEILLDSGPELETLRNSLRNILDGESELRFYRLCLNCRKESRRIDGAQLAAFPAVVII